MAQNFLYMFEFVVDDLLITRPNYCAPEEYPTCCEISFRSSVFVSVCDREYGTCVDPCQQKCGKCCLFSLESPVTDKDRLHIHVYKKKTDRCKFLIGIAELPVKGIFDRVNESFNAENPNWEKVLERHMTTLPDMKAPTKHMIIDNMCFERFMDRKEQLCPTSELSKRLLPLFNLKKMQTGNLVLIMRLVCNGPAIVSTFPFARMCSRNPKASDQGGAKKPNCICSDGGSSPSPKDDCGFKSKGKGGGRKSAGKGVCVQPDPCEKEVFDPKCLRYFACNLDKLCPCDVCEDEFDRECPTVDCSKNNKKGGCGKQKKCNAGVKRGESGQRECGGGIGSGNGKKAQFDEYKRQCGGGCPCATDPCSTDAEPCCSCCDECCEEASDEATCPCSCDCNQDIVQPCFIQATKRDPGPEAYDEFEACLNGSGLTIRVLKDTHKVESIDDGIGMDDLKGLEDDAGDCCAPRGRKSGGGVNGNGKDPCIQEMLQRSPFARNHIKRRTGGCIVNHPNIPQVRANIKYSGNEDCGSNYYVPFSKIRDMCENQISKVDAYRKSGGGGSGGDGPPGASGPTDSRNCCLQVDPKDIKDALKGINNDTRKKGIEVCYKTCEETDSDVFLVKLGSKSKSQKKKNTIEIELRTPKMPVTLPIQKVTTETYVTEDLLKGGAGGGKKGKKGKKGKGGKKGKKK